MTKQETVLALKAAKQMKLKITGVTGGNNGYPEPFLGQFIGGFETFEDADKFKILHGGEVKAAHKKNGWGFVEITGDANKSLTPSDLFTKDDHKIIKSFDELKYYAYSLYEDLRTSLDAEDDADEIQAAKAAGDELVAECSGIDFEQFDVIINCGEYSEFVWKTSMTASYDADIYQIGIFLTNDFDSEDEL